MNSIQSYITTSPYDKDEECGRFLIDETDKFYSLGDTMVIENEYVFSCWVKSESDGSVTFHNKTFETGAKWIKAITIFTADTTDFRINFNTSGTYFLYHAQLEIGNVSTDWTPNPDDVDLDINEAQNTASNALDKSEANEERLSVSESTIKQLSDSISMLVTDENGSSMMTQTSNGWTFNIGEINQSLNDAAEGLTNLSGKVDAADSAISNLESLSNDLAEKTAYITLTTDSSGTPCIELGKADNPFKVRITNTSVDFIEGSAIIAYISNKTLYIEKAIIKNELQIGEGSGFIWKRRSNGNMGLRWTGG